MLVKALRDGDAGESTVGHRFRELMLLLQLNLEKENFGKTVKVLLRRNEIAAK
jgi:hypothetical protein